MHIFIYIYINVRVGANVCWNVYSIGQNHRWTRSVYLMMYLERWGRPKRGKGGRILNRVNRVNGSLNVFARIRVSIPCPLSSSILYESMCGCFRAIKYSAIHCRFYSNSTVFRNGDIGKISIRDFASSGPSDRLISDRLTSVHS